ncbi:MAG: response regulator [Syntrophobacteraceae bacterium]
MMFRILVIDDSSLARRTLSRILEPADYEVIEAEDGLIGLEKFMIERPDLVFLDLTMPGLSGIEVLEKMREIDPEVRVIVATADIQTFTRTLAAEAGALAFIMKPFEKDAVLDAVRSALSRGE